MAAGSISLLAVGRVPALLPVFLVVHGFTVPVENVMLPLVVAECFGARHLAAIYGALMLVLLPEGVLGPVFAGWVYDRLGTYLPAFALFAVPNVGAVLALTRPPATPFVLIRTGSGTGKLTALSGMR